MTALCADSQVKAVGKDNLVLDLSCKQHEGKYHVATNRWQTISSLAVTPESLAKLAESCAEFLVHGIDKEGKQQGIDEELVKLLSEHSPAVATYAGGVRSMVSSHAHLSCNDLCLPISYMKVSRGRRCAKTMICSTRCTAILSIAYVFMQTLLT